MMVHYYAQLKNNMVRELRVVADAVLQTEHGLDQSLGAELLASLYGGEPTDYVPSATSGDSRHIARIGFTYDKEKAAFIPPKPYDSWILDEETFLWAAPVPMPGDGDYTWNEGTQSWDPVSEA
ncbi:hypothetical protein [Planktomarina sp.]|uniref:hypothetical protein n=1 Tax=Planktomarina sp. TaxID=2024851 RepID=UPI00326139B4